MRVILLLLSALSCLASCSEIELASHVVKKASPTPQSVGTFKVGNPYKINGRVYHPREQYDLVETGIASWYGPGFHNKQTANGETYDMNELTAAHRTLQMPSLVRVTNLENGRSLIVRVNDRGPYKRGRIIDLSKRAAELLGYKANGTAKVRIEVLKQESMQIAQAAKAGKDTSGYEVAVNRRGTLPTPPRAPTVLSAQGSRPSYKVAAVQPGAGNAGTSAVVQSVERETLIVPVADHQPIKTMIPGHTRGGQFYPDPVITENPVTPTNIYVQAGAFTVYDNAMNLRNDLQTIAKAGIYPAAVNGQQFHRVRLGPLDNVDTADEILARLVDSGYREAIIIVE